MKRYLITVLSLALISCDPFANDTYESGYSIGEYYGQHDANYNTSEYDEYSDYYESLKAEGSTEEFLEGYKKGYQDAQMGVELENEQYQKQHEKVYKIKCKFCDNVGATEGMFINTYYCTNCGEEIYYNKLNFRM
jgi:hypothetical protein